MLLALSNIGEFGWRRELPLNLWLVRAGLAAAAIGAVNFIETPSAYAVPSYARQTGQPCATCHTAFPELTPYGRQFKLMGYTAGGNRCDDGRAKTDETQVPLSLMTWPAMFTHVNSKNAVDPTDSTTVGQNSLFIAGQLYCDVGAFAQMTYSRPDNAFTWDNTDIRYAKSTIIDGTNVVYGVTANNNPTMQDVWNTIPAWSHPYIASSVAPGPGAGNSPMIAGKFGGQAASVGAYVWIDRSIYAEFSAYANLPNRWLTNLTGSAVGADHFANMAPYWRLAYEKTWDKTSLMFGTFGMYAGIQPVESPDTTALLPGTDPTLDIGVDAQYQWISDIHAITLKGAYIWENRKNSASQGVLADNASNQLNSINISGAYVYDRTYSFSAGYFDTWGTADATLYGGSPNANGWTADVAYLPFSKGGPEMWPWFNARIGVLYSHFDKVDPSFPSAKASNNDSVLLYTWLNF
jgi:hypothetical protein